MQIVAMLLIVVLSGSTALADGGDTIGSAVAIPSLPFEDTGNTCSFSNDYDWACPFPGSTAPDVVYSFTPTTSLDVEIDLCNSGYDTKVYVWEDEEGNVIACSDDSGCGYDVWQSRIPAASLAVGHTYYVVIDGFETACGEYHFSVGPLPEPCSVECPPGSMQEGEPPCQEGHIDTYNSGCDGSGWTPLAAQQDGCTDMCGRTCVLLEDGVLRPDLDWYTAVAAGGPVSVTLEPEVDCYLWIGLATDCEYWGNAMAEVLPCGTATLGGPLPPGQEFWIKVYPSESVPASAERTYHLRVCGIQGSAIPVDRTSWGRIKNMYRRSSK